MTPISEKFSWKSLDDGRVLKELEGNLNISE